MLKPVRKQSKVDKIDYVKNITENRIKSIIRRNLNFKDPKMF